MSSVQSFKQKLAHIFRLWEDKDYDKALSSVEELRDDWPGNAQLQILWASLVQLQEDPGHGLGEVEQALRKAIDLDKPSPCAAIELGHFLDAVEDDPQAAAKVFSEAVLTARKLLIEGLIGQARALLQLGKREEVSKCLLELLYLLEADSFPKRTKSSGSPFPLKGPFADQVEELLSEVFVKSSA